MGLVLKDTKQTNFDELMNMILIGLKWRNAWSIATMGVPCARAIFSCRGAPMFLTSQNPSLLKDISDVKGWNNPSGYTGILSQVFFIPRDCEWISHWKEASYSPICLFYPSISERPKNLVSQNIPIIPHTFISSPQSYPGEAHGLVVRFESWGRDYHPNNPHNSMPNTCQ